MALSKPGRPRCPKVYPGDDHTFIGGAARQIIDDIRVFIGEAALAAA